MLVRIILENFFSFGERKEFTTIPNKRLKTLDNHLYRLNDFEILKLSSIYGANGAGKSNLIKALHIFQKLVTKETFPYELKNSQFKFNKENNQSQIIAVEFIQENTPFLYAIELKDATIAREELYVSGLGKKDDKLVYERLTTEDQTTVSFLKEFENDAKSQLLKSILIEEFIKVDQPILKLLSNRDNKFLGDVKKAFAWFEDSLQIILPDSKPRALANKIDVDAEFKQYAENLMLSFNIGISSLHSDKIDIKDFFGEDNENEMNRLIKELESSPKKMIGLRSRKGDEIMVVKEKKQIWVKILKVEHQHDHKKAIFDLDEESDGTVRLLDFVPAFKNVISESKVYFVDEIERSIHPLLIKELIKKFSLDNKTAGQLIFTTHESNLLDQELFRQDEIWFAEKNHKGSTDLYSLSDFKEHKTIDIRKGYLNGRYGSIPFLGNLTDLNWHQNDNN